jgi:hypothetical protein
MAEKGEQGASLHQAQYDSGATESVERCGRGGNFMHGGGLEGPCWTSTQNPTAKHIEEADKLRKAAADHRAAAQALRDAEAAACEGLSDDDRDISPFEHYADIASVDPIYYGGRHRRLLGATVHFRAVPGLTAQWLQRQVDCHLARIAALGHDLPEMPTCPLVPRDVTASVSSNDKGFDVDVKSWDEESAREVFRRARRLVGVQ